VRVLNVGTVGRKTQTRRTVYADTWPIAEKERPRAKPAPEFVGNDDPLHFLVAENESESTSSHFCGEK
jgi:hypothetical protein